VSIHQARSTACSASRRPVRSAGRRRRSWRARRESEEKSGTSATSGRHGAPASATSSSSASRSSATPDRDATPGPAGHHLRPRPFIAGDLEAARELLAEPERCAARHRAINLDRKWDRRAMIVVRTMEFPPHWPSERSWWTDARGTALRHELAGCAARIRGACGAEPSPQPESSNASGPMPRTLLESV